MSRGGRDRIGSRPDPEDWGLDELLTLAEATRLFWPHGPLTVSSLRRAIAGGRLGVCEIAGKHFVTRRAIQQLCQCSFVKE